MTDQRIAWLRRRQAGIGASEFPAICNLSPWKSQIDVWAEKVRVIEDDPQTDYQIMGHAVEGAIVAEAARRLGENLQVIDLAAQPIAGPFPFQISPDGLLGKAGVVEAKNVGWNNPGYGGWGEPGTDQVPEEILLQALTQLVGLDREWCTVAALFGGNQLHLYTVRREAMGDEQRAIRYAAWWWNEYVVGDKCPPVTRPSDRDALARRWPKQTEPVLLRCDQLADDARAVIEGKRALKQLGEQVDLAQSRIAATIGEFEGLEAGAFKATWKAARDSELFDLAAAKRDVAAMRDTDPERAAAIEAVLKAYTKPKSGGRRLLVKNGAKDDE